MSVAGFHSCESMDGRHVALASTRSSAVCLGPFAPPSSKDVKALLPICKRYRGVCQHPSIYEYFEKTLKPLHLEVLNGTTSVPMAEKLLQLAIKSPAVASKHSKTLVQLAAILLWIQCPTFSQDRLNLPTAVMDSENRATQALARWIVNLDQPEFMMQEGCRCKEVRLVGMCLFAFQFGGQLHFLSVFDAVATNIKFRLAPTFPLPDSCKIYYEPYGSVGFHDELPAYEGCAVRVSSIMCAPTFRDVRDVLRVYDSIETVQLFLKTHLHLSDSSVEMAKWFLQKVREDAKILTMRTCTGLTHPVAPFLMSSNIIIIDDAAEVARWERIAFGGPVVESICTRMIPYTMPPALSDIDEQLQQAYLSAARMGIEDASPEVMSATSAALREQLQNNLEALGNFNEQEISDVIGNAKSLVQKALAALHATEHRKHVLETVAREALLDAANRAVVEVVAKEVLREEWRRREHWVRREAQRQGPKKGRNKQHKEKPPQPRDSQSLKQSLERAVEHVERRSAQYKHAASTISALERNGYLRRSVCETAEETTMKAARQQLALSDGPETLFDGEIVELVVPKRAHPLRCLRPANASGGSPRPALRRRDVLPAFDAAQERDSDFAAAHQDELALKLGIQISLAENAASHENLPQSSRSHEQPVIEDAFLDEDAASRSSRVSWVRAAGGDDCFVDGTLFQLPTGLLVPVQQLEVGSIVCGSNGGIMQVTRFCHHERQQVQLVELRTHHASIVTTANHRIVVQQPESHTSNSNTVTAFAAASMLSVGQHVIITNGITAALTRVELFLDVTDVYQITFEPDEPVEVFVAPPHCILSLGEQRRPQSRTRRSGMARRQRTRIASIPGTDDGLD